MSNPFKPSGPDAAAVAGRWLLGALFIYMGLSKALQPEHFLELVNEYHIVSQQATLPFPLRPLNAIGAALPWFEVFCGALLIAGVAVRGTALVLLLMLGFFTLAVLQRALHISAAEARPFTAVKFDCGCGNGVVFAWRKLIENSLLILLAAWLLAGRGRMLCARFALFAL
jgi:putative oxidoreductase